VTGANLSLNPAPVYSGACSAAPVNVADTPCIASYTYPGDANHTGSNGSATINITKANQTITFNALANKILGNPDFSVSATASSGLSVSFAASPSSVCTISGSTVHLVGAGTCTITASQAGNGNYNAASSVSRSFTVSFVIGGSCLGSPSHTILQPINPDGTSSWKARNTVPVKFRVCDANGNSIGGSISAVFDPLHTAAPILYATTAGALAVDEVAVSTTPDTIFRWSASDQQWIFNLNTNNLGAGKTYFYRIYLADGSTIQFQFGLK